MAVAAHTHSSTGDIVAGKEKKSKKDKKEKVAADDASEDGGTSYDELLKRVNAISKPMASKKLTKKILKVRCCRSFGGAEPASSGS